MLMWCKTQKLSAHLVGSAILGAPKGVKSLFLTLFEYDRFLKLILYEVIKWE